MAEFTLRGTGVALVTPFGTDDQVDYDALRRLVDHIIGGGADFIVVLGTTAETPTLTPEERDRVATEVARHALGRVPLVLGVGGNCTASVIDDLKTHDLSGYSAILSVVPFYNKPVQRGIEAHFTAIADASPLPVILYNIPGRSGVNMTTETTLRLAKHPNIIGVKEASGNLEQIYEILDRKPDGFEVISGDDSLTLDMMRRGGSGVISVIANALPDKMKRLTANAADGDFTAAEDADRQMHPYYGPLFTDGNPAGIKALLAVMGMIEERLRLPLVEVTEQTRERLREVYGK